MADRVADWLVTDPEGVYWDATVGAAGHARKIVERLAEGGRLFGSDRDPGALELARAALAGAPVVLVRARFSQLAEVWRARNVTRLNGILFDFGIGSFQLDDPARGLSFTQNGPLDMRLDGEGEPLADWLNRAPEAEIASVISGFGEERRARALARAVVRRRPLDSTEALRSVVAAVTPAARRTKTLARVFQAFRIRVNAELDEIRSGLDAAVARLSGGGRIVTIAYHSLEDRLVKQFLRRESRDCICPPGLPRCACSHRASLRVLTRRAEVPGPEEIRLNRRARSARLRAAERLF